MSEHDEKDRMMSMTKFLYSFLFRYSSHSFEVTHATFESLFVQVSASTLKSFAMKSQTVTEDISCGFKILERKV